MNKDNYLKAISVFNEKIDDINAMKKELKLQYIKENAPYPIGTKFMVHMPDHYKKGTFKALKAVDIPIYLGDYSEIEGNLEPKYYKIKKDGNPSTERFHLSDYRIINENERKIKRTIIK